MSFALLRARRRQLRIPPTDLARLTSLSVPTSLAVPTIRALEAGRGTGASAARAMGAPGLVWAWPETVTEPPGPALARLRRAAGMSQRERARAAGISHLIAGPTMLSPPPADDLSALSRSDGLRRRGP
jgi:hypothetical protein